MLAIFLSPIYLIFHGYLCWRLLAWLAAVSPVRFGKKVRRTIWSLYFLAAISVALGTALPPGEFQRFCIVFSNYWLGVTIYEALIILPVDLICFLVKKLRKRQAARAFDSAKDRKRFIAAGALCITAVAFVSIYGIFSADDLQTVKYQVAVEKDGGRVDHLKTVLIADLHLGYSIGEPEILQMVKSIKRQKPDLILIAGDIFDNDYNAIQDPEELIALFRQLSPKYGIYACWGNHDIDEKIVAGFTFGWGKDAQSRKKSDPRMDDFLKRAGIKLLQDEGVLIDESFYIYGRPDAGKSPNRKTPEEVTAELDLSRPVLLIDHQPKELQELAEAGVDIDFCGHTHDGQLFPMNLTQHFLWENPWGYIQKGAMHNIVTSGVGLFGPNMRVGTKPEICVIDIDFTGK